MTSEAHASDRHHILNPSLRLIDWIKTARRGRIVATVSASDRVESIRPLNPHR
jgi:hypothetical protein